MTPAFVLRHAAREWRAAPGRIALFLAALAIGVAAVVTVEALSAGVDAGVLREGRKLLAADLAVRGGAEVPDLAAAMPFPGVERADLLEMVTIASAPERAGEPGRSGLVEIKAVTGAWPFYGDLVLEPARPLAELLAGGDTIVVARPLLARLGLAVGDSLRLGDASLRIVGLVLNEPDRVSGTFTAGPRVLLSRAALARTGLESRLSRMQRKALFRLPPGAGPGALDALAARLRVALRERPELAVETWREAQPGVKRALTRMAPFLALTGLLALLSGGIGVAASTRARIESRLDAIAVLRALGMTAREVLLLDVTQTAALALCGSALGAGAGLAVAWATPHLLASLLPPGVVVAWQPLAALHGIALGTGVALLFALPPLLAVRRVPPVRVLRRTVDPPPPARVTSLALAVVTAAGIAAVAAAASGQVRIGIAFAALLLALAGLLALAAVLLARAASRLRALPLGFALRHGIAALARPGAGTRGSTVAVGLGLLVVLAMSLVQRQLAAEFERELPASAPSSFLLDIQPAQWPGVEHELRAAGAVAIESVPVVTARLREVDGKGVRDRARERPEDRRWALTREQRLTYLERLPEGNSLVAGELWSDPSRFEVSLEEEFAASIGAGIGSRLLFDVQGVPIELAVTSLRHINWRTFGINFFLVAEPGALERAPQFRLASARFPPGGDDRAQDAIAARFANVTVVQVRTVVDTVLGVLRRLGLGVRVLGGFTVVSGLVVLAAAVSAGAARRGREVALLKAIGLTRGGVVVALAIEHALVGLVAAVPAAAAATLLAWLVVTRGLEMEFHADLAATAAALAAGVVLSAAAGVLASLPALVQRPVAALRAS